MFLEDDKTSTGISETISALSKLGTPLSSSDQCFGVEVDSNSSPLESEIIIQFMREGWHFLRLTLADHDIVSSYTTQMFVTLQQSSDNWNCKPSLEDIGRCVWTDGSMTSSNDHIWGIDWPIEDGVGWGTIGRNIVTETFHMGISTIPLSTVDGMNLGPLFREKLHNSLRLSALLKRNHLEHNHSVVLTSKPKLCGVKLPFPIFHALGRYGHDNRVSTSSIYQSTLQRGEECSHGSHMGKGLYWGNFNVAIMFSENSTMTLKDLNILKLFDVNEERESVCVCSIILWSFFAFFCI
jgi:hypothetical protein